MIRTGKTGLFVLLLVVGVVLIGCRKRVPEPDGGQAKTQTEAVEVEASREKVAVANSSTFEAGFKIEAGGKVIDVEVGHLVPDVVDWNNDGKKDMVVGQFKPGGIQLYLNEGTDAKPVFGEGTFLNAGDKPIKLDAG